MKTFNSLLFHTVAGLALTLGSVAEGAAAAIAISGRPVPKLVAFDDAMTELMSDNDIEAGVLGVMRNGTIVYLRGFGLLTTGVNMPENALVRLASCTKPITAAAVRERIESGTYTLNQRAFNITGNGGALNVAAFPQLGDARYRSISISNLLTHSAGWDRTQPDGDLTYQERTVSKEMGLPGVPGRANVLRWVSGHPLYFAPGTDARYSNEGYLSLGFLVDDDTSGYLSYLRTRVFTPSLWIPSTEVIQAATYRSQSNVREPWYRTRFTSFDVQEPGGDAPIVNAAYGSFDLTARLGQGGIVASAAAMLELGNRHHIQVGNITGSGRFIGLSIDANNPLTVEESHNGGQPGVNTQLWHRTDGVVAFVFFNKNAGDDNRSHYGGQLRTKLNTLIAGMSDSEWPTASSDGFWVLPQSGEPDTGLGGYHSPYKGFASAVNRVRDHSRVRLKPGTTSWTGLISKRLFLDAPLGTAVLGQ